MNVGALLENIAKILGVFTIIGLFAIFIVCVMLVAAPRSFNEQKEQDDAQMDFLKEERKRKENKK